MVFVQKGYFWSGLGHLSQKFVCFRLSLPSVGVWCLRLCVHECVCVCRGVCKCGGSTCIRGDVLTLSYIGQKLSLGKEDKDKM